jgi:hypothetical protein
MSQVKRRVNVGFLPSSAAREWALFRVVERTRQPPQLWRRVLLEVAERVTQLEVSHLVAANCPPRWPCLFEAFQYDKEESLSCVPRQSHASHRG